MFFDQLDERNAMVESILSFEEVGQPTWESAKPTLAGSAPEKLFSSPKRQMR